MNLHTMSICKLVFIELRCPAYIPSAPGGLRETGSADFLAGKSVNRNPNKKEQNQGLPIHPGPGPDFRELPLARHWLRLASCGPSLTVATSGPQCPPTWCFPESWRRRRAHPEIPGTVCDARHPGRSDYATAQHHRTGRGGRQSGG